MPEDVVRVPARPSTVILSVALSKINVRPSVIRPHASTSLAGIPVAR